jgi:hypothetical protein
MMKKIALIAAAVALGVGIASIAAEGGRYDAVIVNPTGGVAKVMCHVGDVARLDYSTDAACSLELVHAVGNTVLSAVTITNTAAAASGTVANLGYTGGDDYLRLSGATNVAAKIYMILK